MTKMDGLGARLAADLVRAEHDAPAPTDLVERLLAGARRQTRHAPRRAPRWVWPALAAATVLLVVLATLWAANGNPFADRRTPATPLPTDFRARTVQFVDSEHGWAVGGGRCGSSECAVLAATTDGGRSWHALTVPAAITYDPSRPFCADPTCIGDVTFAPDGQHGYLFGVFSRSLYRTSDGGHSWAVQAASATSNVVVSGPNAVRTSGFNGNRLSVAPLGSNRWQDVTPWPQGVTQAQLVAHRATLYALASGSEYAWLYRSTDAGHTWRHVASSYLQHEPQTFDLHGSSAVWTMALAPDGAVVVARFPDKGTPTLRISTDGGTTFGAARALARPASNGTRLSAASATTLVETAQAGSAVATDYLSSDAGSSWHVIGHGTSPGAPAWAFTSAEAGYAVTSDQRGLVLTTNGGKTFFIRPFG